MGEEPWLVLGTSVEWGTEGPLWEEISGQVFVLEKVLGEAWHVVGYFEEVQLTQLF